MPVVPVPVHQVINDSDLCIREAVLFVCGLVKLDAAREIDLVAGRRE